MSWRVTRSRARRDANEAVIVAALRAAGCSVQQVALVDGPDLLVGRAGRNYLLECKRPRGAPSASQEAWHRRWAGQVAVVRTELEALEAVGIRDRSLTPRKR